MNDNDRDATGAGSTSMAGVSGSSGSNRSDGSSGSNGSNGSNRSNGSNGSNGTVDVAQTSQGTGNRAGLMQTPSQTVGPFFAYGLAPTQYGYSEGNGFPSLFDECIADDSAAGEPIEVIGNVYDGAGEVVPDALIEILQADANGEYVRSDAGSPPAGFVGFGRSGTGTDPRRMFRFRTIRPGATRDGQAPHLNVIVLMRGLLVHAYTRAYFEDEEANATDPVLRSVPAERRKTLIAVREGHRGGRQLYRFDIRMQGPEETVFFDV